MENLLTIAQLKAKAHSCYYIEIKESKDVIKFIFYFQAKIDPTNIAKMSEKYQGALKFVRDAKEPYFEYHKQHNLKQKGVGILERVNMILEDTRNLLVDHDAIDGLRQK